jgi:hypothetical protein
MWGLRDDRRGVVLMPFKSERQRRMMWAQHPEIAKRWADEQKRKGEPQVVAGEPQGESWRKKKKKRLRDRMK